MSGPALPALGHAVAGSTGSAISNVCTYPLDLIITRLQIQRSLRKNQSSPNSDEYDGILDGARTIYADGGISAFYTGILPDTGKTIADSFLFFLTYTFLRQRRLLSYGSTAKHLPALDELSVGFVAGATTKLLTSPLANIVTRKQTTAMVASRSSPEAPIKPAPSPSSKDIAQQIYSEKGLLGFWSGYSASLILTLNPSLTFFLHSFLQRLVLPRSKRENPSPTATFLLAAFSKVVASTVTYPFSLAKSRTQASSKKMEGDSDKEVKEEIEGATGRPDLTGSKRQRAAARSTIFATLLRIAQTEGIGALYEGLEGEVLKSFFSHGITMILKELVHKFIIKAYYLLLIVMRRYPSPEELMQRAQEQASEYASVAKDNAIDTATEVKDNVLSATAQAKNNASSVLEKSKVGTNKLWDRANETAELVHDYVEEEAEEWRSLYSSSVWPWDDES